MIIMIRGDGGDKEARTPASLSLPPSLCGGKGEEREERCMKDPRICLRLSRYGAARIVSPNETINSTPRAVLGRLLCENRKNEQRLAWCFTKKCRNGRFADSAQASTVSLSSNPISLSYSKSGEFIPFLKSLSELCR